MFGITQMNKFIKFSCNSFLYLAANNFSWTSLKSLTALWTTKAMSSKYLFKQKIFSYESDIKVWWHEGQRYSFEREWIPKANLRVSRSRLFLCVKFRGRKKKEIFFWMIRKVLKQFFCFIWWWCESFSESENCLIIPVFILSFSKQKTMFS